ncbi:hypothetical protein BV898_16493 [Hypsibius exemplaris]|uniref:Uncharacterized protein n=1 Tax=Hypsibius exemplaris TaxID=2072580 RepID=A0A9X6NDL9_HYPEX|nr:hypothetical protein BV898_16493 [Hypsibius exemplaris]
MHRPSQRPVTLSHAKSPARAMIVHSLEDLSGSEMQLRFHQIYAANSYARDHIPEVNARRFPCLDLLLGPSVLN